MFKVKYNYVDSITMLVRLDLNLIVSLFQHKGFVTQGNFQAIKVAGNEIARRLPCVSFRAIQWQCKGNTKAT